MIVFVPSLMAYMVLPFSRTWVIADLPYGLLFVFAVMSFVPLGILAAGWASNNKWSLIGAMRAVGSQVTYEVPMLLAALSGGDDGRLAQSQRHRQRAVGHGAVDHPQVVRARTSRRSCSSSSPGSSRAARRRSTWPRPSPSSSSGYATEYASMKFGLLFLSEFSNIFLFSALLVTLFFGGWQLPWVPGDLIQPIAPIIFMLKTYFAIFLLMVVRGTLPRVRVDQMLSLGWKVLLPASLAWVMITGLLLKIGQTWAGPR